MLEGRWQKYLRRLCSPTQVLYGVLLSFWRILLAAGAVALALYAFRADSTGTGQGLLSLALVAITAAYVVLTSDIAGASARTVAATEKLATRTAELAEGTGRMARATETQAESARALVHLQSPVLVLRVCGPPKGLTIPLEIRNVGEGAAIWPRVRLASNQEGCELTEGPYPPYIHEPRQFDEEDNAVLTRQRFELIVPQRGEYVLDVSCEDPRTGDLPPTKWRVHSPYEGEWRSDLVPDSPGSDEPASVGA